MPVLSALPILRRLLPALLLSALAAQAQNVGIGRPAGGFLVPRAVPKSVY